MGPGITGDPDIQKIGDIYVMFYFGAFWKTGPGGVFNRFRLLLTIWYIGQIGTGEKLIQSSEPYDNEFAHKSSVVYWKGIVYHFYCAVDKAQQRGIAVANIKRYGQKDIELCCALR